MTVGAPFKKKQRLASASVFRMGCVLTLALTPDFCHLFRKSFAVYMPHGRGVSGGVVGSTDPYIHPGAISIFDCCIPHFWSLPSLSFCLYYSIGSGICQAFFLIIFIFSVGVDLIEGEIFSDATSETVEWFVVSYHRADGVFKFSSVHSHFFWLPSLSFWYYYSRPGSKSQ